MLEMTQDDVQKEIFATKNDLWTVKVDLIERINNTKIELIEKIGDLKFDLIKWFVVIMLTQTSIILGFLYFMLKK